MYRWIWRRLPGRWPLKLLGCLVLFVGVVALLFLVIFPWIDPKLPWNNVGVNGAAAWQLADHVAGALGGGR